MVETLIFLRVGDHNIDEHDSEEAEYGITSIEFHEDFNVGPYLNNDIAIASLGYLNRSGSRAREDFVSRGGIQFGQFVAAVCLPPPNYM